MKLRYYTESTNFGDQLNPYIFGHFLPDFFDDDSSVEFLGIGSTIGIYPPRAKTKKQIVFSSGFAYGELPQDFSRHEFWCVRGPETAAICNLPTEKAIADGALLLAVMPLPKLPEPRIEFAFMPHEFSHLNYPGWRAIAKECGFHYINPLDSVDMVLTQIRSSQCLLTEAMHGAIVADTLRVPWIPVKLCNRFNAFKWLDWSRTIAVDAPPVRLPELIGSNDLQTRIREKLQARRLDRQWLQKSLFFAFQHVLMPARKQTVMQRLRYLKTQSPHLSPDGKVPALAGHLLHLLRDLEIAYR